MSKVRYVYIDEWVCSCLGEIRKMNETRDYSSLMAVVERIQHHVNMMEAGLEKSWKTREILFNKDMDDKEKIKKLKKAWKKHGGEE